VYSIHSTTTGNRVFLGILGTHSLKRNSYVAQGNHATTILAEKPNAHLDAQIPRATIATGLVRETRIPIDRLSINVPSLATSHRYIS
jgi:hypothetical protein